MSCQSHTQAHNPNLLETGGSKTFQVRQGHLTLSNVGNKQASVEGYDCRHCIIVFRAFCRALARSIKLDFRGVYDYLMGDALLPHRRGARLRLSMSDSRSNARSEGKWMAVKGLLLLPHRRGDARLPHLRKNKTLKFKYIR